MVGQKLAPLVTVASSILATRRTGTRNYFFRTMASNDRANPAGPRIKTETVPSDLHAGHVLEMKRDPSYPECGHIKHLTRTSAIPVVGNPSTQELDLYKTHDGNYQRTINPYAYIRPRRPQTRMCPANYRKIRGALASPTALLSVLYSYLCIYNRSVIVSWLRVCP